MKNEYIYNNRIIIEGTNGYFTAYYSNHSSNLTKEFRTLNGAKRQIDRWLKENETAHHLLRPLDKQVY